MGDVSFLTGSAGQGPRSVGESIYQLQNCSELFVSSWQKVPKDIQRAARVSEEAMVNLDHIVNEILRVRDTLISAKKYAGSNLNNILDAKFGKFVSPATEAQFQALVSLGAGNGRLPGIGNDLSIDRLINKIKHRRPDISNFRIDNANNHIFMFGVDRNSAPESIVEFSVPELCKNCLAIAKIL